MWRAGVCLIFIGLASLFPQSTHAETTPVRFVDGPCPFSPGKGFVEGRNLQCGNLVVPEDRSRPDSPSITLAVAILRSSSPDRQPDPVVFLNGGPGQGTIEPLAANLTRTAAQRVMGDHDLILIDQRGTGLSRPSLTCPEVDRADQRLLQNDFSPDQQVQIEGDALAACRARLTGDGVDVNAYSTLNDAADIADLRTALGLQSMDLYSVSYGTRLALAIMRAFPTGIRSVVLDSVVAPGYNLYVDSVAAEAHAFSVLFKGCAHAARCGHRYPRLQNVFRSLLHRLNQHPLQFTLQGDLVQPSTKMVLNGNTFAHLIRGLMYYSPVISSLPSMIWSTSRHHYTGLQSFLTGLTDSADMSTGMYQSVLCEDDAPFATSDALRRAAASLPRPIRKNQVREQQGLLQLCRTWNVSPAGPSLREPVTSNIPTLLLAGEYDPITPPGDMKKVAATLSHSHAYTFPGVSHGVRFSSPCASSIVGAFYDNPNRAPGSSCIKSMKEPFA